MRPKTEIEYARSTKLPDELTGFMRLAQDTVKVNIIGNDSVGVFSAAERSRSLKAEERHLSAYIVIHEQDAAQFVRNTRRLQQIKNDPELAALLKAKGLDKGE